MDVIDDTPVTPATKKRNTTHWKAVARSAREALTQTQAQVTDLRQQVDEAHDIVTAWQRAHARAYQSVLGLTAIAAVELVVILWLALP